MAQTKDNSGKVGTDAKALHDFGGKGDFGIPVHQDIVRDHEGVIEGRPGGSSMGDSPSNHDRTVGVGSNGTNPGEGSGGDIDTDYIGLGGPALGGRAPFRDQTEAETAKSPSSDFAGGKPAAGKNSLPAHQHGASGNAHGDSTDHSGVSQYDVEGRAAGAVNPIHDDTPGAEGEVTLDEATGASSQGGDN